MNAVATPREDAAEILAALGVSLAAGPGMPARSAIDGSVVAQVAAADHDGTGAAIAAAQAAFLRWRLVPAPRRGEAVRRIGEAVRQHKDLLARLITLEVGKIPSEAAGEVQEWIDLCDFAVGESRRLHGLTIASERPGHRLMEQWHPLGPVGVITAFNFPVAVWAWNAMLALVCGDSVVWKPSEKANLCAVAASRIAAQVLAGVPEAPPGLLGIVCGDGAIGAQVAADARVALVSATGSVRMGRAVAQVVAGRLGRSLLELGGNNALVVTPSADLDLAVRAIVFAAAGTCGQRCTTLRRLIVHRSIVDGLCARLVSVFARLRIGDPRAPGVMVGPLIDAVAASAMDAALDAARADGHAVLCGGLLRETGAADPVRPAGGAWVAPAIVHCSRQTDIVRQETFAPILYVCAYTDFSEAVALANDVPQGLSAAICTTDAREAERFLAADGSDCGIVNVNMGTSGAEIGGAFGGEKQTGGGRESGSDSWKAYMRRTTNTVNFSDQLPLAQGVDFG
jgi:aldehyde dehydrogenase (NAD+)